MDNLNQKIEVSVVIPCLNEADTLGNCVTKAMEAIRNSRLLGEVIVVDNGSTDSSGDIAVEHGGRVVLEEHKGYGYSLFRGFREARGKYIVFADADESYDFAYVGDFVRLMRNGAELVMGSRMRGSIQKGAMPFLHRYLGTPALTVIARTFFHVKITDINCGMRGLTKDAFTKLNLTCGGMEFASEMVVKAARLKLKIAEIPIDFRKDKRNRKPHLRTFKDGWRHLRFILLFAPKWIFLLNGLVLFVSGFIFMLLILFGILKHLGIFAMLISQSLILLGFQLLLFGISSYGFPNFLRYNREEDGFYRFFKNFTVEKGILWGLFTLALGLPITILSGIVIYNYLRSTNTIPTFYFLATKWAFFGVTLVILSFQIIISSFYLSLFHTEMINDTSRAVICQDKK